MTEPVPAMEYGRPPRRRRWRVLLIGLLILGLLAGAWHYRERVRAYVADAYAEWQYRRTFDRAWAQLPMTDGVWRPSAAAESAPDAKKLLAGLLLNPPPLAASTNVLFINAFDQNGERWLSFACTSKGGLEVYTVRRSDRNSSGFERLLSTRERWDRSAVKITLHEVKLRDALVETTIDIDGRRNVVDWEMLAPARRGDKPLVRVTARTGWTTADNWQPSPRGWMLLEGPAPAQQLPSQARSVAIGFLPDGRLVHATRDVLIVTPPAPGAAQPVMLPMPPEAKSAATFAFSRDGAKLFLGQTPGATWVVDLSRVFDPTAKDAHLQAVLTSDPGARSDLFDAGGTGEHAIVLSADSVKLVNRRTGMSRSEFARPRDMEQLSLSPDEASLAIKSRSELRICDTGSGAVLLDFVAADLNANHARVKWSADGQRGAIAGYRYVYLWSLREPRNIVRFAHAKMTSRADVALSRDGKRMAVSVASSSMIAYWPDIDAVMEGSSTRLAPSPR